MSEMSYFDMYRSGLPVQFFPQSRDELGNAEGYSIPAYNRIGPDDSLMVQQAKQAAQNGQVQRASQQNNQQLWFQNMLQQQQQPQQGGTPWDALAKIGSAYFANLAKQRQQQAQNPVQQVAAGIANSGESSPLLDRMLGYAQGPWF